MSASFVLVLSFLLGVLVPTPAWAAPPEEDIQNLPVPETVPEWVWRTDTRHPTEWGIGDDDVPFPPIFEDGFRPKGEPGSWNENLADHVINKEEVNRSAWVSTAYDQDEAVSFGKSNLGDSFWEYQLAPDDAFHSVQTSFKEALLPGGEYNEDLADRFENAKGSWFGDVESEAEFAAFGEISEKNLYSARQWTKNADGDWVPGETVKNPRFTRPGSRPSLEPYEIPDQGECYGGSRAACALTPQDEGDLSDLHGDRFTGDTDDFDFSLRVDELAEDESLLLAPAPDSVEIVADYADGVHDGADFERFTQEIGAAFEADADALAEVSSASSVIEGIAESLDVALDAGSELLPYFGIVATGWALKGDIEHGDWGDAAADAIAEAIQGAMIVAPEFDFVLVPLLWVDQIAKAIGDWAYELFHPAPDYTEEYRNQLEKANDQVDAAPGLLIGAWKKERDAVLLKFSKEQVEQRLIASLVTKIRSDVAVLRAMDAAVGREITRHANRAAAHATTDAQRQAVRLAELRAHVELRKTTQRSIEARIGQYEDRYEGVIVTTAAATWNLSLEKLSKEFVEDGKVANYLTKVSEIAQEAYFEKPFEHLDPWDKEVAAARGEEERAALRALPTVVERNRVWDFPRGELDDMIDLLNEGVAEGIADVRKLSAAPKPTTLGVHGLRLGSDSGSPFTPGASGTVRWDQQGAGSAIGVDGPVGTQFSWRLELPTGLDAGALPTPSAVSGWKQEWQRSEHSATLTVTRTSGDGPAFDTRRAIVVPVKAGAIEHSAPASVVFTAPNGFASTNQLGSTTAKTAAMDIELLPVEPQDTGAGKRSIRVGLRMNEPFEFGAEVLALRAEASEYGVGFPNTGVLAGVERATEGAAWERPMLSTDLSYTYNGRELTAIGNGVPMWGEAGHQYSWELPVEVRDTAADLHVELPYSIAITTGGSTTTLESVIRFSPQSALKPDDKGSAALSRDEPTAVPVTLKAVAGAVTSISDGTVSFEAPDGTLFEPTETLSAATREGTAIPNAAITGLVSEDGGRTMKGIIRGGSVAVASGGTVQWKPKVRLVSVPEEPKDPGIRFTVEAKSSAGSVKVAATRSVSYPQGVNRVTLHQNTVPSVDAGAVGAVEWNVQADRQVEGLSLRLRAQTGTRFTKAAVGFDAQVGGVSWLPGTLSADARVLTVPVTRAVPVRGAVLSVFVAVDPDTTESRTDGTIEVSGPVESSQAPLRVQVAPAPKPGDIAVQVGSTPTIPKGDWAWQEFTLSSTNAATAPFRLGLTLPEGADLRGQADRVQIRPYGASEWVDHHVEAVSSGYRSAQPIEGIAAGRSVRVRAMVWNRITDWEIGARTGGVVAVTPERGSAQEAPFSFVAARGADEIVLLCRSDAPMSTTEVRIRWSKAASNEYRAVIEEARMWGQRFHDLGDPDFSALEFQLSSGSVTGGKVWKNPITADDTWHRTDLEASVKGTSALSGLQGRVNATFHYGKWYTSCESTFQVRG